jgi:hypothetical protein
MRSTIARPGVATAYAAGDEISNSATAGSVVRATFDLEGFKQGKLFAAEIDITTASGDVVTAAADIELLIFRTADVPAAVGDNVTHPIAASNVAKAVGRYRFDDTGWTGQLGTVAASPTQLQAVMPTLVQPLATNVLHAPWYAGFPFTFEGQALSATGRQFTAVLRALAAWTPGAVVNNFGITLDIEVD